MQHPYVMQKVVAAIVCRKTLRFGSELVNIFFKLTFDYGYTWAVDDLHAIPFLNNPRRTAFFQHGFAHQ